MDGSCIFFWCLVVGVFVPMFGDYGLIPVLGGDGLLFCGVLSGYIIRHGSHVFFFPVCLEPTDHITLVTTLDRTPISKTVLTPLPRSS